MRRGARNFVDASPFYAKLSALSGLRTSCIVGRPPLLAGAATARNRRSSPS